jgi:hypothetical protein
MMITSFLIDFVGILSPRLRSYLVPNTIKNEPMVKGKLTITMTVQSTYEDIRAGNVA